MANVYADAAGDLNTVFGMGPADDQQDDRRPEGQPQRHAAVFTIGLSNNAYETLAPAEQNFIDAIKSAPSPLKVTSDYPGIRCLFKASRAVS